MVEAYHEHRPHALYTGIEIEEDFYGEYAKDESVYNRLRYFKGDV